MTFPGIAFSFGWLNGEFVLGYGYPRKCRMRGKSAIYFASNEVGPDSRFFVFLQGILRASVKGNGERWDGMACGRHALMT